MVKRSERERASVHVMFYALLVFAFSTDRFRRPAWFGDPDGCVGGGGGGRNSKDEMLGECEKKKKNEGLAR